MFKTFALIDKGIDKLSRYGLVLAIAMMLFFSLLTIVLRWFNTTYLWMDPLVRHLVFLSAFLGGVLATGAKNHIGIDVASKIFETRGWHKLNNNLRRLVDLGAVLVLVWLTKASVDFVKMELEFGGEVMLGIHSGVLVMIIPFGFGLIAYRFFFNFLQTFQTKAN
ncbi:MAG: TRAP transporter small permease [Bacteriovoracaceae bacterium]